MIEAVEIATRDNVTLRGEVAVRASDWLLLAHAPGEDIDAWRPLSNELVEHSLTVLAVDLRGHGGSDGNADARTTPMDIDAMVSYALSHGALRIFLCAAGESVVGAQEAAERHHIPALVLVAPTGLHREFETPIRRLVLFNPEDPDQETAALDLQDAPGWSLLISVPDAGAGLDLLGGAWCDNVIGYVTSFLRDIRLQPSARRSSATNPGPPL